MENKVLLFRVNGTPQGKARPRVSTANGFTRAYTPAKTRKYEQDVAREAKLAAITQGWKISDEPIVLVITAWFQIPKSWPKWKKEKAKAGDLYPTVKPDADNIGKAIADALNGIVYADDSQIVGFISQKRYCRKSNESHVMVAVERMRPTTEIINQEVEWGKKWTE